MAEKRNIFLIGPMGAGKSTIGKYLAQKLNMDFYDSDKEIENRTGADIAWVFDVEGEIGFRNRESKIIDELTKKNGIVLATGGGSIVSEKIRNMLSSRGTVIYLKTTIEKQLIRTKRDKNRPLLNNKELSNKTILENLAKERNHLYNNISDLTVDTDLNSAKSIASYIFKKFKNNNFL
ncbi:shikimate kinase AroK [Buchnera aphidicola (Ceratoglyphina bambusae)]|uniref:shikimate kinase AroK n=1 Tax=Buchnera aphidicola TaxID=9 RepID=UPI0031B8148E